MGHDRMASTLATTMGGEMCLWDSEVMGSKPRSNSWSNSFVIGIYPDAYLLAAMFPLNILL